MWKVLGGVFIGVFVGALAVELIKRTRPELLDGIEQGARAAAETIAGAFRETYRDPLRARER